jgi:hypothetical protein
MIPDKRGEGGQASTEKKGHVTQAGVSTELDCKAEYDLSNILIFSRPCDKSEGAWDSHVRGREHKSQDLGLGRIGLTVFVENF